jgi:5-hydroxyisourate hydrolase
MAGGRLNSMGISTHILDTSLGRPAAEVPIALSIFRGNQWVVLSENQTDADGRCRQLLPEGAALEAGLYRLRFDTAAYYETLRLAGLYPYVEIAFEVRDMERHYHIPLLLTANGYTTYRGS